MALPPDKPHQAIDPQEPSGQQLSVEVRFGPLPPSEELKEYEKILPGITERKMALIENEVKQNWKFQHKIANNNLLKTVGAIVVPLTSFVLAGWLAWLDYPAYAVIVAIGGPALHALRSFIMRLGGNGN